MVRGPRGPRRIRLVAYGARLESVLSESSQGFESPILRQSDPGVFRDRNVFAASLTNDLITPSPRIEPASTVGAGDQTSMRARSRAARMGGDRVDHDPQHRRPRGRSPLRADVAARCSAIGHSRIDQPADWKRPVSHQFNMTKRGPCRARELRRRSFRTGRATCEQGRGRASATMFAT